MKQKEREAAAAVKAVEKDLQKIEKQRANEAGALAKKQSESAKQFATRVIDRHDKQLVQRIFGHGASADYTFTPVRYPYRYEKVNSNSNF